MTRTRILVRKVYDVHQEQRWCWYPVEEQLHRKSTRTGRRRKQPSPAAPEPKLLKLSPKSLLFPTFTGFLHSSALFYIKHNYTRERQWIAADFFQRRAIKSSDTKITDRTSHSKLHLIEHMILQKKITSENIIQKAKKHQRNCLAIIWKYFRYVVLSIVKNWTHELFINQVSWAF